MSDTDDIMLKKKKVKHHKRFWSYYPVRVKGYKTFLYIMNWEGHKWACRDSFIEL